MMHLFTFTFADTEDDVREESEEESVISCPTEVSQKWKELVNHNGA